MRLGVTAARVSVPVVEAEPDIWIEVPLQQGWMTAFRISAEGRRPRVAEVRVFPREEEWKSRPRGEWSALFKGCTAPAPRQGVTKRLLSKVPIHLLPRHLEEVRKMVSERSSEPSPSTTRAASSGKLAWTAEKILGIIGVREAEAATIKKSTRGRKPLTDEFLAEVARDYVNGLKTGKPTKTIAQTHGVSPACAGGWVSRARRRGFLEEGLQGISGGRLTGKAKLVLARMRRKKTKRG